MFRIYIVSILKSIIIIVYYSQKVLTSSLNIKEIIISIKYFNFTNIYLFDFAKEILEYINIKNY